MTSTHLGESGLFKGCVCVILRKVLFDVGLVCRVLGSAFWSVSCWILSQVVLKRYVSEIYLVCEVILILVEVGYEISETINHFGGVVDLQNAVIGHLDSCGFLDDFFIQCLIEPAELLVVGEFPNHMLGGNDVTLWLLIEIYEERFYVVVDILVIDVELISLFSRMLTPFNTVSLVPIAEANVGISAFKRFSHGFIWYVLGRIVHIGRVVPGHDRRNCYCQYGKNEKQFHFHGDIYLVYYINYFPYIWKILKQGKWVKFTDYIGFY